MIDPKALAKSLVTGISESAPDTPEGDQWVMKFCAELRRAAASLLNAIAELQEHGPDQTGNIWPGCVCNDARYDLGHMESCPWHGYPPDRPTE